MSLVNMNRDLNVFSGETALIDFHNPSKHNNVPLVELPPSLNTFADKGVRIFIKLMNLLPLANVKSIPAFHMLDQAKKRGDLNNISTIVEASSGNTVLSLTAIAHNFGIQNTKSLVSNEISPAKLKLLQLYGTVPVVYKEPICADPKDPNSRLYRARDMGKEVGVYNPDQYSNLDNPHSHYQITGKQIWDQTEGKISIFVSSLGTTGTVIGASKYLQKRNSKVVTIAGVRKPNNLVPGLRTVNLLREIEHDWEKYVNHIEEIGTADSYLSSLKLIRLGLFVGPSAGLGYMALINYLSKMELSGELDDLRNQDGQIVAVFIGCDSPSPYIDEYFKYVPKEYFPEIENAHLLEQEISETSDNELATSSIDALDAYKMIYPYTIAEFIEKQENNVDLQLRPGKYLLDVRNLDEYEETHLYGAQHIELSHLIKDITIILKELYGQEVYVYCHSGQRSRKAVELLIKNGVNAINIEGGIMSWSANHLPRYSIDLCLIKEK